MLVSVGPGVVRLLLVGLLRVVVEVLQVLQVLVWACGWMSVWSHVLVVPRGVFVVHVDFVVDVGVEFVPIVVVPPIKVVGVVVLSVYFRTCVVFILIVEVVVLLVVVVKICVDVPVFAKLRVGVSCGVCRYSS